MPVRFGRFEFCDDDCKDAYKARVRRGNYVENDVQMKNRCKYCKEWLDDGRAKEDTEDLTRAAAGQAPEDVFFTTKRSTPRSRVPADIRRRLESDTVVGALVAGGMDLDDAERISHRAPDLDSAKEEAAFVQRKLTQAGLGVPPAECINCRNEVRAEHVHRRGADPSYMKYVLGQHVTAKGGAIGGTVTHIGESGLRLKLDNIGHSNDPTITNQAIANVPYKYID